MLCVLQPKAKRMTTAKAPLSMAIHMEDIMSSSDNEEEEEWQPEKQDRRRGSKRPKATGVRCRRFR